MLTCTRGRRHVDRHKRPFVCSREECSSLPGFTWKGGLKRHEKEVHETKQGASCKVFVCPISGCGRAFTRRSNRKDHVSRVHRGTVDVENGGGEAMQVPRDLLRCSTDTRSVPRLMMPFTVSCPSNGGGVENSDTGSDDVRVVDRSDGAEVESVDRRFEALDGRIEELAAEVHELVSALSKVRERVPGFLHKDVREDDDEDDVSGLF